jgi:uncharacterized protein (DUF488 family)
MESRHLFTVGHGTLDPQGLTALLVGVGVDLLVDVRRYPGSRRQPLLAGESIARWLSETGVGYRWDERLGGRRRVPGGEAGEDPWWRVGQFRAYAAHTRAPEFRTALSQLLRDTADRHVAVMCSESVWWRCHRRLIADVVALTTEVTVQHLGHDGRLTAHPVAAGARVRDDGLVAWTG